MSRELDPPVPVTPEAGTRPGRGATTGAPSPQPYLDHLTEAVERLNAARSLSRQPHALAEDAPIIANEQLRDRLLALADRARALP